MTNNKRCDIIAKSKILGCRQAVRHQTLTLTLPGFESLHPSQKNTAEKYPFLQYFFYPSRRLGISSPHEVWWISSALWAVYHHASACIFLRLDDIQCLRIDDMPQRVADDIHAFGVIGMREYENLLNYLSKYDIIQKRGDIMSKNYLLIYSEQLATDIELMCQSIKAPSNTLFQIRKSSSSVYANIREANYGQSKADMLSKFEIALKECSETEGWLQLLFNTNAIDEETYKKYRNLCGRIRRMLISSCKTLKENLK